MNEFNLKYKTILSIIIITINITLTANAQNEHQYFEAGKKYLEQKKYKNAVLNFTKTINENDHISDYYLQRGLAFWGLMDRQKGYDDFTSAIKYDYTSGEAYFYRAMIFMSEYMYLEAINDFDMLIKYPPNDSLLYLGYLKRGESKGSIMDYNGSLEDCNKFLQYDSCNREALNTIALAKNDLKQPEEALGFLYKSLKHYPGDTLTIANIGFINLSLERWDSAFKYLDLASKLKPKQAFTYSNLSFVKMKKGDLTGALKDVNYSLALDPENSWAYRNRGLIYGELKQNERSCEDFHMAVKKGFTERYGNEVRELIYSNCGKK